MPRLGSRVRVSFSAPKTKEVSRNADFTFAPPTKSLSHSEEKIYLTRYLLYAVAHYRGGFFVYISLPQASSLPMPDSSTWINGKFRLIYIFCGSTENLDCFASRPPKPGFYGRKVLACSHLRRVLPQTRRRCTTNHVQKPFLMTAPANLGNFTTELSFLIQVDSDLVVYSIQQKHSLVDPKML